MAWNHWNWIRFSSGLLYILFTASSIALYYFFSPYTPKTQQFFFLSISINLAFSYGREQKQVHFQASFHSTHLPCHSCYCSHFVFTLRKSNKNIYWSYNCRCRNFFTRKRMNTGLKFVIPGCFYIVSMISHKSFVDQNNPFKTGSQHLKQLELPYMFIVVLIKHFVIDYMNTQNV